jgi:hypothetical protein
MRDKPNFYAIIPANVRYDKDLTPNAKLLYGEITALCNAEGFCWAGNNYFAEMYGMSVRNTSRLISQLHQKGYISVQIINDFERRIYINTGQDKTVQPHDENVQPPMKKMSKGHDENVQPPHDRNVYKNNTSINNTNNNTRNKKNTPLSPDFEKEFTEFWQIYPKRSNNSKKEARLKFIQARKKKKIPYETILNGLYQYKAYLEATDSDEQYIAHASTWLNQERWENDYLIVQKKKKMKNFMDLLEPEFGGVDTHGNARNPKIVDHNPSVLPYS